MKDHHELEKWEPVNPIKSVNILLVEDSEDIVYLTSVELERQGYQVHVARNGMEGLETARREQPDLIISDIRMPQMDGYEFIRLIRQIPSLASTPAIAFTGLGMKRDAERALACGYTAHLGKPIDMIQLSALIQNLILNAKNQSINRT